MILLYLLTAFLTGNCINFTHTLVLGEDTVKVYLSYNLIEDTLERVEIEKYIPALRRTWKDKKRVYYLVKSKRRLGVEDTSRIKKLWAPKEIVSRPNSITKVEARTLVIHSLKILRKLPKLTIEKHTSIIHNGKQVELRIRRIIKCGK